MVTRRGIMIHATSKADIYKIGIAAIVLAALGGCAGSSADYPSFSIPTSSAEAMGENNRVAMRFPGVESPEPIDVRKAIEPLPADIDARIAALDERASNAMAAFLDSAGAARRLADAARGAAITTDRWAAAQVSLADLSSHHSDASLALADLDLLAAQARTTLANADVIEKITEAQTRIAAKLSEQGQVLLAINSRLDR